VGNINRKIARGKRLLTRKQEGSRNWRRGSGVE